MNAKRALSTAGCFAAGLTGLLLLAGCGQGLPHADEAVEQQIFLVGNGTEPKTLDPHVATGVTENKVISALIEGLINYHLTNDELPEPGVAESWESSEDASVWTFHIRPNARWSNGDPITAHDFVYSYQRILTPELAGEYANMLYVVENAEAYHKAELTDFEQVGVKALDDQRLEITLVGPTPYFLNMLKHYSWFPVHPATVDAFGGMANRSGNWTRPGNFVGNGPFVLSQWRPDQYIRVTKSPTYWDSDTVRLNEIIFFPVNDTQTELRMFQQGQLHKVNSVPSNAIPGLKESEPDRLRIEPYLGTYFYRFNVTRPPFDDPRVRLALNLAVDRKTIVEQVTLGDQIPATGYVPNGFETYDTAEVLSHDPDRARALLAEAGFPGGSGFPSDALVLFNTLEDHRKIAEAIVAMWEEELGIRVGLENKEWKVYLDATQNLDYDISRAGWIGDYIDPITFLEMFTTGNGNNDTGWSNAAYDRLIAEAMRSVSEADHYRLLREAEDILLEELPILPLYWYTRNYLIDARVQNWYPKLLDNRPYKYIYLADAP